VNRKKLGTHVCPSNAFRVKPNCFRVPDICVVAGSEFQQEIFTAPPLLCIEIFSEDDRWSRIQERIDDYLSLGVPHVWVIDPRPRKALSLHPQECTK
jgi:Uma2 family endonuclease